MKFNVPISLLLIISTFLSTVTSQDNNVKLLVLQDVCMEAQKEKVQSPLNN